MTRLSCQERRFKVWHEKSRICVRTVDLPEVYCQ